MRRLVWRSGWFCVWLLAAVGVSASEYFELGPALQLETAALPPSAGKLGPPRSLAQGGLSVDTGDRAAVAEFFKTVYQASEGIAADWVGNIDACLAGTTSQAYEDATLLRVNYFRAMAGLNADIIFNDGFDSQCQEAALMMIANQLLSHTPPSSWTCWTQEGADAAGDSNIALGAHGPAAIDGYIKDPGGGNERVGHRNWILFPMQQVMGTGSITERRGGYIGSNALWVIDQGSWSPRPASPEAITWPPEGYAPYQVVYPRWSLSYYQADFTGATVAMTRNGQPVSLNIIFSNSGIYFLPDNIIVWEPEGFPIESAPPEDIVFQVTVDNVLIDGTPQSFSYSVTVIDPDRTVVQPTSTPTATPGVTPAVTATPTATPGPPPVAVLPEHLFDISLNWQNEDYSGPADLTGDGRVDEEDVFDAIQKWSD